MKKLKFLFAVITVFALLFVVASAETSALKFGAEKVQYTEGESLTVSVYANEAFTCFAGGSFEIVFDNTVWAYSSAAFNTELTSDGFVSGEDGTGRADAISVVISGGSNKTLAVDQKIVDLTFTKIAGEAAGTSFVLDYNVFGGNLLYDGGAKYFDGTITVEAAKTTEYEEVTVDTPVVADTTPIVLGDDVTYTNVAKFVGSINLGTIKSGFTGEEALLSAGIKHNGAVKYTFPELGGDGEVAYSVLFWGITPEQAATVDIDTFYTAKLIKK